MSEQDLRNAFANKEASLLDVPYIEVNDILHPLYTKTIKRMRMRSIDLWNKDQRGNKFGINEIKSMFDYHLGI